VNGIRWSADECWAVPYDPAEDLLDAQLIIAAERLVEQL
jgi:hypothetical protein